MGVSCSKSICLAVEFKHWHGCYTMDTINTALNAFALKDPMHYMHETMIIVLANSGAQSLTDWLTVLWCIYKYIFYTLCVVCLGLCLYYMLYMHETVTEFNFFSSLASASFMLFPYFQFPFYSINVVCLLSFWSFCGGGFVFYFQFLCSCSLSLSLLHLSQLLLCVSFLYIQRIHSFSSGLLTLLKSFRFIWNGRSLFFSFFCTSIYDFVYVRAST